MKVSNKKRLAKILQTQFASYRRQLANADALLPFAFLGLLAGFLTGIVVTLFRWVIDISSTSFLPGNLPGNYEDLPLEARVLIPITGAFVISLFYMTMDKRKHQVGIVHVIARLNTHHGHLPWHNIMTQFFSGALAMITGFSSGREGPAVHLGAGFSSQMGQKMQLPNNSMRVLVGCGVAAGIAACFNTPIAGVIFAMEVVLMEYTIAGFMPVILAAVAATVITQLTYGAEPGFIVPYVTMQSYWELPYLILLGACCSIFAGLFILLQGQLLRLRDKPVMLRFMLAGLITALLGALIPSTLGISYDSMDLVLSGQVGILFLLTLGFGKFLASATASGLGLPVGVIAPSLIIGACTGAILGIIGQPIFPGFSSSISFYAILGAGAMMAAILNAPLAAIMALLEFTNNAEVILPSMLTVISATLAHSLIFKQPSLHRNVLKTLGSDFSNDPLQRALSQVGVISVMNTSIAITKRTIKTQHLELLLARNIRWLVVEEKNNEPLLLSAIDLSQALEEEKNKKSLEIDLLGVPGKQQTITKIDFRSSLAEAWMKMQETDVDMVYVSGVVGPMVPPITGLITRQDIDNYFQPAKRNTAAAAATQERT